MKKHETKLCQRCGAEFECKCNRVIECRCMDIKIPHKIAEMLKVLYDDCLCVKCLKDISSYDRIED